MMTTSELRAEIHKAIDNLPDRALLELLEHINSFRYPLSDTLKRSQLIDKIFEDDDNLLRRLAE